MGRNNGAIERGDIEVFLDEGKLLEVRKRRKPTRYFWCDMTDIFGEWMKPEWLSAIFATIDATPQHTHMLLTKRPENVRRMWNDVDDRPAGVLQKWRENVWIGTSISDQPTADKNVPKLLECRDLCQVLFLSAEPLLGSVDLRNIQIGFERSKHFIDALTGVDLNSTPPIHGGAKIGWTIVGCESNGKKVGRLGSFADEYEWQAGALSIVQQCRAADVAAFVKQVPINGRVSHDAAEWAPEMRVREFPELEVSRG